MNWTIGSLLRDVADAWSAENWPYTLAFWIVVGGVVVLISRRRKER
jgi:hypothetical protein